ncbi:MAG: hypothetical protein INQ03_07950 [Candidatus Heimdallarchaeota archaeon]|nr:hypothetical protein [Candidatus Heimdallarchaeota archaeon]
MRKVAVFATILLIFIHPVNADVTIPTSLPARQSTTTVHVVVDSSFLAGTNYTLQEVLAGIDQSKYYPGWYLPYIGEYTIDLKVSNLTQTQHDDFVTYLGTIAAESNTYNGSISRGADFVPIPGISYDAEDALDWIANNLWDGDETAYTLFLFNLEELDEDLEHWFNIKPLDMDSGEYADYFFSGTSGLFDGKAVSGWGGVGDLPVHFIDISSRVWYGDFINNVWGPPYYYDDILSHNVQDFDNRNETSYLTWVQGMINPLFDHLFSNYAYTFSIVDQYNVPAVVLTNITNSIETEAWVIDEHDMEQMLNDSFPFIDFNVTVQWQMMEAYEDLMDAFDVYVSYDSNRGINYIELTEGMLFWLESNLLPQLFGDIAENDIPSLILMMDGMDFRYNGVSIAGLGGMGWQFQIMSRDRFYRDGEPIRGFSEVIVHEVGHSMGFPHPFEENNGWISDFTASIMGYYTSYPGFSLYNRDALARIYADNFLVQAEYLSEQSGLTGDTGKADIALASAQEKYANTDYVDAIEKAKEAIYYYYNTDPYSTEPTTSSPSRSSTTDGPTNSRSDEETTPIVFSASIMALIVYRKRR